MKIQRKSKKSDSASKLVLEEIIGLSTKNANGLSANILTGDCVYIAGCVVVVYNVESGTQSHLMVSSRMPKPLSCVAVSSQHGGFIAAGESGHQPAVLVWDYSNRSFRFELKVHSYGVACIAFSPDGKHLVSVGFPHDGYFCLWDLRIGSLVTKLKSSSSCSVISSVSFSSDADFFITAGKKHLKFWTVGSSTRPQSNSAGFPAIDGKSANLGLQKGSSFISVTSAMLNSDILVGRAPTAKFCPIFALTDTGTLCLLDSGFSLKMSVDLKVEKTFALSVSNKLIACGCNNGVVQLFTIETLKFAGSLQYCDAKDHPKATVLISDTKSSEKRFEPILPDAIACQFSTFEKLVVVYGNHSLYIWDVRDVNKVSRCAVLVSHSACIWDVKNLSCENMHDPALACVARGCCGGVSFATCSADGTIRLWDLAFQTELDRKNGKSQGSLDADQGGSIHLVSAGIFERDLVESGASTQGFRSMAVSSDGKYLAAGDSRGNLHIYNLDTADYTCIEDAHDAEILSLTFSLPSQSGIKSDEVSEYQYLLASGGRDRLIHLYDVKRGFELIKSLDDHSAAVTSVKLTCNASKILSCSADRSLVFRDVAITDIGCKISRCHHQIASNGTVYDMAIDPSAEVAVTVGQDKKIKTFNIFTGKLIKTFKQDGDLGEPIKVSMDPSSSYLVCSYSNKSVCIYDFTTGELVTQVVGHSEVITGVIFLPDCKHIISVGGDGCIFVWKIPSLLSSRMLQSVKERVGPLSLTGMPTEGLSSECLFDNEFGNPCGIIAKDMSIPESFHQVGKKTLPEAPPGFRFSISRLPNWARAKVSTVALPGHPESTPSQEQEHESPLSSIGSNLENSAPRGTIEDHSPCEQLLGASDICPVNIPKSPYGTDANRNSPVPDVPSTFAMDKRWLTIHTVYADILDSPEDTTMLVPTPILDNTELERPNKDEAVEFKTADPTTTYNISLESFCGSKKQVVDDAQCQLLSEMALREDITSSLYEDKNFSVGGCAKKTCCETSPELTVSETSESLVNTTKDDEDSGSSSLDGDLFSQHFSTLSTALKIEGRRSARRSYSAHFVVRRDHLTGRENLTGCRRLFEASNQYSNGELLNSRDEPAPHISSGETQALEEQQPLDTCEQDVSESLQISVCSLQQNDPTSCHLIDHPITTEEMKENNQRCISEEAEVQKALAECKEALLRLDAAAAYTIQSFSKLASIDNAPGHRIEFNDWAAQVLPSITEKFEALGSLVHSSNRSSSTKANAESSRLEPLVEKFAESLSRQVLELVKKNLSS